MIVERSALAHAPRRRAARHADAPHRLDDASGRRRHAAGLRLPGGSDFWTPRELSPPQTSRTAHNFTGRRARVERRRRQRGPERDQRPLAGAEAAATATARGCPTPRPCRLRESADGDVAAGPAAALRRRGPAPGDRLPQRVEPAAGARLDAPARAGAASGGRRRTAAGSRGSSSPRRWCCRWRRASSGVAIAFAGVGALVALQPANLPRLADVSVDAGVLGFALARRRRHGGAARHPDVVPRRRPPSCARRSGKGSARWAAAAANARGRDWSWRRWR